MLFPQLSSDTTYVSIPGKLPELYFIVWLFSNPGDNALKGTKLTGQICLELQTRIRTLSPGLENNCSLKCIYNNFPGTLTNVLILENCWDNISMQLCSPI